MSHSRALPAVTPLPERSNARAGLRVVEEPAKASYRPWSEGRQTLAPLPIMPTAAPPVKLEERIGRELPSLVPLNPDLMAAAPHPWAVRSVVDFVRLFLPELSLTAAAVAASGVLAVKMAQRLVAPAEALWIAWTYAAILVIDMCGFYLGAKSQPYPVNKSRAQRRLLIATVLFMPHFMGYSLLKALA